MTSTTNMNDALRGRINQTIESYREQMLTFFREIVAIPSVNGDIRAVGERCETEMRTLGYDHIWWDKMGNLIGRVGDEDAAQVLLYDSHIDTVGVGDPAEWGWDPFEGKLDNGVFYARGACDEKASTPGMLYAPIIARELGILPDDMAVYVFLNMEEVNEGSSANAFVQTEGIFPDYVVIGEPTDLHVYRGQKGRVEYQLQATGKSAHAASNHLGDNALYKVLPVIEQIRHLEADLPNDDFLGEAKLTVTDVEVHAGSRNVVPGAVTVYIDRRLTAGEDAHAILDQLQSLVADADDLDVIIPEIDEPSYTGFIFPLDAIYPVWVTDENALIVQAACGLNDELGLSTATGKWDFSTNGVYWAGKMTIPTIGFGPGKEEHAHTVLDQVVLDDIIRAAEWYVMFPQRLYSALE